MVRGRRSSESEYIAPDDSEEVWGYTSKWRDYQLTVLKLEVVDGILDDITDGGEVELSEELTENILLPSLFISSKQVPSHLTKPQRKFYKRVIQVSESSDEPPVDGVVSKLLEASDFDCDGLMFRPRPHLEIEWKGKGISSEPDFGIYSDKFGGDEILEYMMVVEDKRSGVKLWQPERQLCGEMLVASCRRSVVAIKDQEMFGMIVRGNVFRFYRVIFPKSYLVQILEDRIPMENVKIIRYPPSDENAFSLTDPGDRLKIVNILSSIRERIKEHI